MMIGSELLPSSIASMDCFDFEGSMVLAEETYLNFKELINRREKEER